jgi:hypothetical protein
VVPELPFSEHPVGPPAAPAETVAEVAEERVEVVVVNDEGPATRVVLVVLPRIAVFPAPFSPNTTAVAGSPGSPKTLSQLGW